MTQQSPSDLLSKEDIQEQRDAIALWRRVARDAAARGDVDEWQKAQAEIYQHQQILHPLYDVPRRKIRSIETVKTDLV